MRRQTTLGSYYINTWTLMATINQNPYKLHRQMLNKETKQGTRDAILREQAMLRSKVLCRVQVLLDHPLAGHAHRSAYT